MFFKYVQKVTLMNGQLGPMDNRELILSPELKKQNNEKELNPFAWVEEKLD